jgi:hypothetical protein
MNIIILQIYLCVQKVRKEILKTKIIFYFSNLGSNNPANNFVMGNKNYNEIGKKFKYNNHSKNECDVIETDDSSIHSYSSSYGVIEKKSLKSSKNIKSSSANFKLGRKLSETQKSILKESLFRALYVKSINFNDDLCYIDKECPCELNNAANEPGIQAISDFNKKIYYKFKERTRRGEYPPLEIIDEEIQVKDFITNFSISHLPFLGICS